MENIVLDEEPIKRYCEENLWPIESFKSFSIENQKIMLDNFVEVHNMYKNIDINEYDGNCNPFDEYWWVVD